MAPQKDEIVDIPDKRVRFFGTNGKMLLPCPATIAALIKQIPTGNVMTTDQLLKKLTTQFGVQGTCPVTARKALQAIANDDLDDIPFWRVINKNGGLIAKYPGGVEAQAAQLRQEGFDIDASAKKPRVKDFSRRQLI